MPETPFDNVDGAHEYVGLLLEAVGQARREVEEDREQARAELASRRLEALQIVAWKLTRLETQLQASHRLLNDLRRLRRLLLAEDAPPPPRTRADEPDEPYGV